MISPISQNKFLNLLVNIQSFLQNVGHEHRSQTHDILDTCHKFVWNTAEGKSTPTWDLRHNPTSMFQGTPLGVE